VRRVEKSRAGARLTALLAALRELEGARLSGAGILAAATAPGALVVGSPGTERRAARAFVLDWRAARVNVEGVFRPLISFLTGADVDVEPTGVSSSLETPCEVVDDWAGRGGGLIGWRG
jgi:hypothetical protein